MEPTRSSLWISIKGSQSPSWLRYLKLINTEKLDSRTHWRAKREITHFQWGSKEVREVARKDFQAYRKIVWGGMSGIRFADTRKWVGAEKKAILLSNGKWGTEREHRGSPVSYIELTQLCSVCFQACRLDVVRLVKMLGQASLLVFDW